MEVCASLTGNTISRYPRLLPHLPAVGPDSPHRHRSKRRDVLAPASQPRTDRREADRGGRRLTIGDTIEEVASPVTGRLPSSA